jgi:K+-transporting ATPase ATPase C chain
MSELRPALVLLALLTLLTGVVYPLVVTGVAQVAFPSQANGSLIRQGDQVIGSSLIGQEFENPTYFWGRLSATTPAYNAGESSGSNLGPLNPALEDEVKSRVEALRAADPGNTALVPVDLATSSGSGLDPHVSPAAAYYQVSRVAKARGLDEARVKALVSSHVEGRGLGILGEPVVNVLLLNLSLDKL